jgi:hypothetical protein
VYNDNYLGEMMSGITKDGIYAAERFCAATGFTEPANRNDKRGDAYDGVIWVEIKKNTFNQVRPYKYLVLVGYDSVEDVWVVISPDEVVLQCANKRGQHTTDPMEVCNLSKVNKKALRESVVTESNLRQSVLNAYAKGEANPKVKEYARQKSLEYEGKPQQVWEELKELTGSLDD